MKQIKNRKDHLFVEYSEPYQFEVFTSLMREVAEVCREQNIHKVLVDVCDMPGKINFMERFQLGTAGAEIFSGLAQVGIAYRKEEINWFAETVGVNRGANVRIFANMEEAMNWLGIED